MTRTPIGIRKIFAGAGWKHLLAQAEVCGDITEVNPWILQIYEKIIRIEPIAA
jgi:hypothetical protein